MKTCQAKSVRADCMVLFAGTTKCQGIFWRSDLSTHSFNDVRASLKVVNGHATSWVGTNPPMYGLSTHSMLLSSRVQEHKIRVLAKPIGLSMKSPVHVGRCMQKPSKYQIEVYNTYANPVHPEALVKFNQGRYIPNQAFVLVVGALRDTL
ncbi:hypothetical protein VNO77_08581 [Canavalia gladiata]|uniref:Uncharacterized protein n=1 Tax=Canavalia gladiata TaxID=3824 RepID=A0AAN9QTU6_CANGL